MLILATTIIIWMKFNGGIMKKIIIPIIAVTAFAAALGSCQKQEIVVPDTQQEVTLTFSSEKPAFDDETKTEWTGETIQWSAGDKIAVAYTVNGNWQNASGDASGDAKLYKSTALEAAAETAKFNVSASFKGTGLGTHVFYGVYPAPSSTDFPAAPVATLTVPSTQTPTASSFDGTADLMTGVSVGDFQARPAEDETISMAWTRLVAHANITLTALNGVTEGETVSSIKLTAQEGANLVGSQKVNIITNEVTNNNNESNILELNGENLTIAEGGNIEFWACILPETLTSLTVVVETNKATYTREITGIEKTFMRNARNILSINMSTAARDEKVVDNSDYSGIYAIVAKRNSDNFYYYLTCGCSNSRLVAQNAGNTLPDDNISLSASKLWNVVKSEDGTYTIQSYGTDPAQYISWTSGNTALMGNEGLKFEVSINDDKTYFLKNGDRWLSLNSSIGNDYFAMYAGTQTQNLYLIPAVEGEEMLPDLSSISVSGQTTTFIVGDTFVFDGTVTATYSNGITKDVTTGAMFNCDLSSVGTSTVTVSYTEANVTKTCSYYIEVVSSADNKRYVKVTEKPDDWTGSYLIVYEDGDLAFDGSLTTLDATSNTATVTISESSITLADDSFKFIVEKVNEAYTIRAASGYYIGQTSDANGLKAHETTAYENTISINDDQTVNIVSGGAYLRYNSASNQLRFRYYKSSSYTGQKAICLYKLDE